MIGYAVWDQTNLISNQFLRQYIRDSFYEIQLDFGQVIIHHDLEHIIQSIDTNCTHLVVFQSGHVVRNPLRLKQAIVEFCQKDFLIAGHIIHHSNTYPYLHPQMFILNMKQYKEFNQPMIGYNETSESFDLHCPERSIENAHDDYTPLWLKPTHTTQSVLRRDFGWNLIHTSLEHNIPVLNLSNDIREAKRYLYPNNKQHLFANCLEKLKNDELDVIPTQLDINQKNYLNELLSPGIKCMPFLFNTEKLYEPIGPKKKLIGLAAGFKMFVLWSQCRANDIVYYDYNWISLRLWKDIIKNWSGHDFEGFCKDQGYNYNSSKMKEVIDIFGNDFQSKWKQYQQCNFKFIRCDLLKNPETLIAEMNDDSNVIWYSNCFRYFEGIRRYGLQGCDEKHQKFTRLVNEKAYDTILLTNYKNTI